MNKSISPSRFDGTYNSNPYLLQQLKGTQQQQQQPQFAHSVIPPQQQQPQYQNQKLSHSRMTTVAVANGNNSNQANLSQIFSQQCIYHPEMMITNFCKKSLMPLCPKCITSYLRSRESNNQPVEIENIDKIHAECKEAVLELEELYATDLRKLREAKDGKANIQENLAEKVVFAKNKVMKLVDTFFENLERDLGAQLSAKSNHFEKELAMAEGFATQKHHELHSIGQKLDGPKYLKYILRLLSENFFEESAHYHKECDQFIQLLEKKSADIFTDDSKLYHLNVELAKFVSIKNSELIFDTNEFNFEDKNPYAATNYANSTLTINNNPSGVGIQPPVSQIAQTQLISQTIGATKFNESNKTYAAQLQKSMLNMSSQPDQRKENNAALSQQQLPQQQLQQSTRPAIFSNDQNGRSKPPIHSSNPQDNILPYRQELQQLNNSAAVPEPIRVSQVPQKPTNVDMLGSFQKMDNSVNQSNQSNAAAIALNSSVNVQQRLAVNKNYFEQFCHQKYIHYFLPGTNEMYYIDIASLNSDSALAQPKWNRIELDIAFPIPNDYQSIVTPQGDVYLCGGIDTSNMQVWGDCYKVDFKYRTLEKKPEMIVPRFLHSLVYLNNAIYALGGFDQQHALLDKCERLNLSDKQWMRIAPLVQPSAQMGVTVFKNRYIVAFSVAAHPKINLIQFYDPMFETWQEVMTTLESGLLYSEFLIRPQCGVASINDSGTILIFGGDESSTNPSNSLQRTPNSFVFSLKSESDSLHFTVGLSRNKVELFNTAFVGLAYPQNGKVFTTFQSQQKLSQKLVTLSNGNWIAQQTQ